MIEEATVHETSHGEDLVWKNGWKSKTDFSFPPFFGERMIDGVDLP